MKKKTLFLMMAFLITIIVVNAQEKKQDEESGKTSKDYDCKHKVTLDEGATIIYDLLKEPKLLDKVQKYTCGGFFKVAIPFTPIEAWKFYPCYKDNGSDKAEVFVCMKEGTVENECDPDCFKFDNGETLSRSIENFPYDRNVFSVKYVKDYLLEMIKPVDGKEQYVQADKIDEYTKRFVKEFTTGAGPLQNNQCLVVCKEDMKKTLEQKNYKGEQCIGLRYFFAFEADKPNKIRLFFVGVQPSGENLIYLDQAKTKEAHMVERDWPPICPDKKK